MVLGVLDHDLVMHSPLVTLGNGSSIHQDHHMTVLHAGLLISA